MFEGNRKKIRSSEYRRSLPRGGDAEALVGSPNYLPLGVFLTGFEEEALLPTQNARSVLSSPGRFSVWQRPLMASDPEAHRQPENCRGRINPVDPRACCDDGAQCAETLFFFCPQQYGVDIQVARKIDTCGSLMCPSDCRVGSTFSVPALEGRLVAAARRTAQ